MRALLRAHLEDHVRRAHPGDGVVKEETLPPEPVVPRDAAKERASVDGTLYALPWEAQDRLARIHANVHECKFRRAGVEAFHLIQHLRDIHQWRFWRARKTSPCVVCSHLLVPGDLILLVGAQGRQHRFLGGWLHVTSCPECQEVGYCR